MLRALVALARGSTRGSSGCCATTTCGSAPVRVLDALRGPECADFGDATGRLLSRPILDQEPPIE